jgi:hypothetical protein
MGKQRIKPNYRRRLLRLPDLDHCKRAVLDSLGSPASRRVYEYAIDQFIAWYNWARPEREQLSGRSPWLLIPPTSVRLMLACEG